MRVGWLVLVTGMIAFGAIGCAERRRILEDAGITAIDSGGAATDGGADASDDTGFTSDVASAIDGGVDVTSLDADNNGARLVATTSIANVGTVEVGVAFSSSSVTNWKIENRGTAATGVPRLTNSNPLELIVDASTCSASVPAGQGCGISFSFKPITGGTRSAMLTLEASPGGAVQLTVSAAGGHRVTVTTTGGGATSSVISTPAGIDCGTTCSAVLPANSKLTARTTNGSNLFFSAWGGDPAACAGQPSADCTLVVDKPLSVSATFSPITNNLIFVTSTTYPTTRGSAAAFDADCNTVATTAGINSAAGTDYVALTSDSASSVRARLGSAARGWIRRDGAAFADTQAALFVNGAVFNTIRFDELGRRVTSTTLSGTLADGTASPNNCENWTNGASTLGMATGSSAGGPTVWLGYSTVGCGSRAPIICMGRSRTAAVTVAPVSGRRIWLTNTLFTAGSGIPDDKCQAERPAGVAKAKALAATTDRAAASVLDMAATYVRPDGVVVGTGAQLASAGELRSGIWQTADLGYRRVSTRIWTGQFALTDVGVSNTTCGNWTMTTEAGVYGIYGLTQAAWWMNTSAVVCSSGGHFYCVEVP